MSVEPDPTAWDAVLKARKVARTAKLLEVAKGKQLGRLVAISVFLLAFLSYFFSRGRLSSEVGLSIFLSFVVATWLDTRTDKRLDALLELFLQDREAAGR